MNEEIKPEKIQIDLLDTRSALERYGGRVKIYLKLLKNFRVEYGQGAAELVDALKKNSTSDLSAQAHIIKGIAASIGSQQLSELAFEVEQGRYSDQEELTDKVMTIDQGLKQISKSIDAFFIDAEKAA